MKKIMLLLSLALATILVMQWRDWSRPLPSIDNTPVNDPASSTFEASDPPAVDSLRPPEDYAIIAERPLFVPGRRPPAEEPEEPEEDLSEEIASLERIDVTAILILSPENASVWLNDPETPTRNLVRLRLGDVYKGWTVSDIKSDQVFMKREGATETLDLLDFSGPNAQSPTAKRQSPRQRRVPAPGRPR